LAVGRASTECYERLRSRVLAGANTGPGLHALRQQGLWAWLVLVTSEPAPVVGTPVALHVLDQKHVPPPAGRPPQQRELVLAWANLLLGQSFPQAIQG